MRTKPSEKEVSGDSPKPLFALPCTYMRPGPLPGEDWPTHICQQPTGEVFPCAYYIADRADDAPDYCPKGYGYEEIGARIKAFNRTHGWAFVVDSWGLIETTTTRISTGQCLKKRWDGWQGK
jgi:hypothetical protein